MSEVAALSSKIDAMDEKIDKEINKLRQELNETKIEVGKNQVKYESILSLIQTLSAQITNVGGKVDKFNDKFIVNDYKTNKMNGIFESFGIGKIITLTGCIMAIIAAFKAL